MLAAVEVACAVKAAVPTLAAALASSGRRSAAAAAAVARSTKARFTATRSVEQQIIRPTSAWRSSAGKVSNGVCDSEGGS